MYTVVPLLYVSGLEKDNIWIPVFEDLGESEIKALMGRPYKRETIAQRNKCSCEHVKPTSWNASQ